MRRIIEGKRYDTETATEIGHRSSGAMGDFDRISESLYRTPRGNYFRAGSGGARSAYGQSCGQNCWCGGEGLIPLTKEEALEWCERWLETDEYEGEFEDLIEEA